MLSVPSQWKIRKSKCESSALYKDVFWLDIEMSDSFLKHIPHSTKQLFHHIQDYSFGKVPLCLRLRINVIS